MECNVSLFLFVFRYSDFLFSFQTHFNWKSNLTILNNSTPNSFVILFIYFFISLKFKQKKNSNLFHLFYFIIFVLSFFFFFQTEEKETIPVHDPSNPLYSLFFFDWFLVELGKQLIESDKDLISILCLNKSINKKASKTFHREFLNFSLQLEFQNAIELKQWEKVRNIFLRHNLSLNPNIKIKRSKYTDEEKTLSLLHERQVMNFRNRSIEHKCFCDSFAVITFLTKCVEHSNVLSVLVEPILKHRRLKWNSIGLPEQIRVRKKQKSNQNLFLFLFFFLFSSLFLRSCNGQY